MLDYTEIIKELENKYVEQKYYKEKNKMHDDAFEARYQYLETYKIYNFHYKNPTDPKFS